MVIGPFCQGAVDESVPSGRPVSLFKLRLFAGAPRAGFRFTWRCPETALPGTFVCRLISRLLFNFEHAGTLCVS